MHEGWKTDRSARLEHGVPIKEIPPTLVQIVWREGSTVLLQLVSTGLQGPSPWVHAHLVRQAAAFEEVAGLARRHNVRPAGAAAARARHDVIERQLVGRERVRAILAAETVAQEHVEPGEGWPARLLHEFLERNDRRQPHR